MRRAALRPDARGIRSDLPAWLVRRCAGRSREQKRQPKLPRVPDAAVAGGLSGLTAQFFATFTLPTMPASKCPGSRQPKSTVPGVVNSHTISFFCPGSTRTAAASS